MLLLVVLITILSGVIAWRDRSGPGEVLIRTDKGSWVYPLDRDRTLTLDSATGPIIIIIADSRVRVAEAHCPEKLCVASQPISRPGESITCLPGRIMITIEKKGKGDSDAEAW
jgi:hypothetical protein